MYIFKNVWINITRNKGRNILIAIILTTIVASTCIALSINNSGTKLVEKYKNNNPVEVSFSLDMKSIRGDRNSDSSITIDRLTIENIKEYSDSKYVKDYYYSLSASLSSDDIEPIDMSELFEKKDNMPEDTNRPNIPKKNKIMNNQDFKLTAYSDVSYIDSFINGTNKITSGEMFDSSSEDMVAVISSDLASENELDVGDKFELYDSNNSETTYKFEIVGIYEDASENNDNFMNMNAMNSQNNIYTNIISINKILNNSENNYNNIDAKYYLNSSDNISKFEKEIREKGLSDYYQIINNQDEVLSTLKPIQNISDFSITFLVIILIVGISIIVIINMINIRDRKYEIGVLRAIGMNKIKVCLQFIIEIFIVALISLIVGIILGYFLSQPVTNKMLENEIKNYQEEQENLKNNFGGEGFERGMRRQNNDKMMNNKQIDYVEELKVNLDIITIAELFIVIIVLTIISGTISIIFINKYEPNRILQNRV